MNCTNKCNQGRACTCVAKVGKRYMASDPLPPGTLHDRLPELASGALLCIVVMLALLAAIIIIVNGPI